MIKSQVKIVSSDANQAEVSAYVETVQVGVIALGTVILQMFMVFLSNCFVAWTQFERQFYCYLVGLVCAAPVYLIAYFAGVGQWDKGGSDSRSRWVVRRGPWMTTYTEAL